MKQYNVRSMFSQCQCLIAVYQVLNFVFSLGRPSEPCGHFEVVTSLSREEYPTPAQLSYPTEITVSCRIISHKILAEIDLGPRREDAGRCSHIFLVVGLSEISFE
jgi:hypothetical protein